MCGDDCAGGVQADPHSGTHPVAVVQGELGDGCSWLHGRGRAALLEWEGLSHVRPLSAYCRQVCNGSACLPEKCFSRTLALPKPFLLAKQKMVGAGKQRPLRIIEGASGVLRPGVFTLVLAPPGSGKTTLLRALSG